MSYKPHVVVWGERYEAELKRRWELDAKAWEFVKEVAIGAIDPDLDADQILSGYIDAARQLLAEKGGRGEGL